MRDHTFTAELLGCTVKIVVRLEALIAWNLDPKLDAMPLRIRSERLALGVLGRKRAKAGEEWEVTIVSDEEAVGSRRMAKHRRKKKAKKAAGKKAPDEN